jgi:[pyruvate, water dikinase]-phosphate phosphotransferase / [pyruvate, water dikinase] kinase
VKTVHLHLVSDSTGETVNHVAKASLVQFDDVHVEEHLWSMVRSERQAQDILQKIAENPGFVLYTIVDSPVQTILEAGCHEMNIPCVSVLQPVVDNLRLHLGQEVHARPGGQHVLNDEYFMRIAAMDYVLSHDDGQSTQTLGDADVVLVGVSRTSKTPTCIYLANRGIKAANIPLVPGSALPPELLEVTEPLIIGLTKDPRRLVQIRRQRLKMLNQDEETDYVDFDMVTKEINDARRLFTQHDWPVINVSRKSIEETSATIIQMHTRRQEGKI